MCSIYVAIEYVQQVQVDRGKGTVIKELESLNEDASVEEIFCCDIPPESTGNTQRSIYTLSHTIAS